LPPTIARRPIKGFNVADFRLVFFCKSETKISPLGWDPGSDELSQ